MSAAAAALFDRLQRMPFYEQVHRQAVDAVPARASGRWLDVGTGPGLVARLAADKGHYAIGLDRDPAMIRAARRADPRGHVRYTVGGLDDVDRREPVDVVSAASLLCVLPDPTAAAARLWAGVAPGGHLLVVETTAQMRPPAASAIPGLSRRERLMLGLWARARAGRSLDPTVLEHLPSERVTHTDLLHGLVRAWVLRKSDHAA